MNQPTDDESLLRAYLDDALDPGQMARIEHRLRTEPQLQQMLERIHHAAPDTHVHSIGMAWVAGRLTCPSRTQWSRHFNGLLEPELSSYYQFHLETIGCPFCLANVTDLTLREKAQQLPGDLAERSARAAGWSRK